MTVYTSNQSVNIPANAANISISVAGANGGIGGNDADANGGQGGGGRIGTFTLPNFTARTLTLSIGSRGSNGVNSQSNAAGGAGGGGVASGGTGGRAGPQGSSGGGGGGGGATGVYDSFSNSWIIVAGGGGGGGGAAYPGVTGLTGAAGLGWGGSGGNVGTISNGTTGVSCPTDGSGGGGGGGGASGGAGGANGFDVSAGNVNASGGGGGGSGYRSSFVTWTGGTGVNFSNGYVDITYTLISPTVDTFSASPTAIIRGQSTTLSWTTTNATSASINQGIGSVSVDGSVVVSPLSTTTYTLTAVGPGNVTTLASIQVTVYVPPVVTLSLDRSSIIAGQSTTLRWNTTGDANNITVSPNITNQNLNSFATVNPTTTTTYTASVSGLGGSDTDSITLTVYQIPTVSLSVPATLNYNQQGSISYSAQYANTNLRITPTYTYDDGLTTGSVVNLPTSSSAELNAIGSSVSGSLSTQIPYTTKGPSSVSYLIEAIGSGGLATSTKTITINIDRTPDNIIIPETEDVIKSQDPVVTPDSTVTSAILQVGDIDIPVEVKSDKPIQVRKNLDQTWNNLRQL